MSRNSPPFKELLCEVCIPNFLFPNWINTVENNGQILFTPIEVKIDKLIEIGNCYGMEMYVEKTKVMRISSQPSPVTIMIDQKQLENVECFKYLGSLLTYDGRCTREIKSRIAMVKAAFSKKKILFTS